ncbi:cupredoxin domain-containing protein [Candidatus Gottesmanbacteria bacterium]|nr:cupredoxin domain-containing protein [Candidatus Gottesmanbacteria bacterium]
MTEEEIINSNDKKPNTMIIVFAFILITIVGGYLFIKSNNQKTNSMMESSVTATVSPTISQAINTSSQAAKIINIEAGSFYYKPNKITVKKGDTVKVVINSMDKMHDFVVDELNMRTPIVQAGDTGEATFVADSTGEYEFYCSIGTHRQQGMVGTLIVEE